MMSESVVSLVSEHPLLRRLAALELDAANFVIFGSAPLLAHGVRGAICDLDIVAWGTAWDQARRQGIPDAGTITGDEAAQFWGGKIMIFRRWITSHWNIDDLINRSDVVAGFRFASLADVLAYKLMLQRPKDIDDIYAMIRHCRPRPTLDALDECPGLVREFHYPAHSDLMQGGGRLRARPLHNRYESTCSRKQPIRLAESP
jgi:hypothetical protein